MKTYDTYIFDLDGTITDTVSVWLEILRDALLHFGVTPPDDKTLAHYSHDWEQLKHVGFPEDKFDDLATFIYAVANKKLPKAAFHTDAYETLEELKNNKKRIAIFSSLNREMFRPAMQYRNLYPLAEVAIAGNDIPKRKPHPDGVLKVLESLQISPDLYSSVVYVGDKDTDIQTAHNAGVDSILFYPISHSVIYNLSDLKKHNPKYIITEWKDLLV